MIFRRLSAFILNLVLISSSYAQSPFLSKEERGKAELPRLLENPIPPRDCETYTIRSLVDEKNLLSNSNSSQVLMYVPLNLKTPANQQIGWTWWQSIFFNHILTFADDPKNGALKELPFTVVFFEFPKEVLESHHPDHAAQKHACSIITDFRNANQHEFIDSNLSRTTFLIDLDNTLYNRKELFEDMKAQKALNISNPGLPIYLYINGQNLGPIYEGMTFLDHERERILKMRDFAEQGRLDAESLKNFRDAMDANVEYLATANRRLDYISADGSMRAGTSTEIVNELRSALAPKIRTGDLNIQNAWATAFKSVYYSLDEEHRKLMREDLTRVIREEWNFWIILQALQIVEEIKDFQGTEANILANDEQLKRLQANPFYLHLEFHQSMSSVIRGRIQLRQSSPTPKFQTVHYRFCVQHCGENPEEHLPRQARRIQLYQDPNHSNPEVDPYVNSSDQFIVLVNSWFGPTSTNLGEEHFRTPFQEAVIEFNLLPIGEEPIRFVRRLPIVWSGFPSLQYIDREPSSRLEAESLYLFLVYNLSKELVSDLRQMATERPTGEFSLTPQMPTVLVATSDEVNEQTPHPTQKILKQLNAAENLKARGNKLPLSPDKFGWSKEVCNEDMWENDFSLAEFLNCFEDKVVVLSVGAPWCAICKVAAPYSNDLYRIYGSEGLVIIEAHAIKPAEETLALKDAERVYKYPSVLLSMEAQNELQMRAGESLTRGFALPTYFYRDHEGKWVAATEGGNISWEIIRSLLAKKSPALDRVFEEMKNK